MSFGEELKTLRVAKKLGQKELGEMIGVSRSQISGLETNEIDPQKMAAFSLINLGRVLDQHPLHFLVLAELLKVEEVNDFVQGRFIILPKEFSLTDYNFILETIQFIKHTYNREANRNTKDWFEGEKEAG